MEISFIFVIITVVSYMDIELIKKIDELIEIFNNSFLINRVEELKNEIYSDLELKNQLTAFNNTNQYSTNYIKLKTEIMNNPKIKEFKKYESELILLTLSINKKLKTLTKRRCIHENN